MGCVAPGEKEKLIVSLLESGSSDTLPVPQSIQVKVTLILPGTINELTLLCVTLDIQELI